MIIESTPPAQVADEADDYELSQSQVWDDCMARLLHMRQGDDVEQSAAPADLPHDARRQEAGTRSQTDVEVKEEPEEEVELQEGECFLEIFAGVGHLSKAIRKLGYAVVSLSDWDPGYGERTGLDLLNPSHVKW